MDANLNVDIDDTNELENMPVCAEYFLINLLRDLSKEADDGHVFTDELKKLKERIDLEGLDSMSC